MKLILLFLFTGALLAGCSNKSSPDPGPAFALKSNEMKINGADTGFAAMKRDEPTSGPQIQVQMSDTGGIVSIEKKLICGPVTLTGRKVGTSDADLYNFRIADEEFPGLSGMPMVAPCKLSVIATNSIGSTTTKTIPMTLSFDKNPAFEIQRSVVTLGEGPETTRFEVPLESYRIKNTLTYPLELRFTPTRSGKAFMHFQYVDGPGQGAPARGDGYFNMPVDLVPTRIELTGTYSQQTGDMVQSVGFTIPIGGEVVLSALAQIPPQYTQTHSLPAVTAPLLGGGAHWDKFLGAYVTAVNDAKPSRSLAVPRGFDATNEDLTNPDYVVFPNESPFNGVVVKNIQPTPYE